MTLYCCSGVRLIRFAVVVTTLTPRSKDFVAENVGTHSVPPVRARPAARYPSHVKLAGGSPPPVGGNVTDHVDVLPVPFPCRDDLKPEKELVSLPHVALGSPDKEHFILAVRDEWAEYHCCMEIPGPATAPMLIVTPPVQGLTGPRHPSAYPLIHHFVRNTNGSAQSLRNRFCALENHAPDGGLLHAQPILLLLRPSRAAPSPFLILPPPFCY